MKHKQLLQLVIDLLNAFDPHTKGVQEYLDEFTKSYSDLDPNDIIFVHEVFSGSMRYDMALKVVVDAFFKTSYGRKTGLPSDVNTYKVLTYLSLYRLEELGVVHFRKFVLTRNINKMFQFLSFFFDEIRLKMEIFTEWCKAYEHSYVEINLLTPLLQWLPDLCGLVEHLSDKVNNKQPSRKVHSSTTVKPFNLTQPKPRSIPMPKKIPKLKKHLPVPDSTYTLPKELQQMKSIKEKNRVKAERNLINASKKQFVCVNTEMSEKSKARMREYLEQEDSKLNFDMPKAIPLPPLTEENIPIRLNAATIMREGVIVQKKVKEEEKHAAYLAMGGRDAEGFLHWQKEMRQKDLEEQLADIEARRLDGKISYEEAILARQSLIHENKQKVIDMKKETKDIMDVYLKEKFKQEKEMRNLVEEIMEGHENVKEAKTKLLKYKQNIVSQVNNESKALMTKALEEAEADMREKVRLIATIRAIESVPKMRFKFVDITETSGAGLLGEMSVKELTERLRLVKVEEKLRHDSKRKYIIQNKMEKDQLLTSTVESIVKDRAERQKVAATRLEGKKSLTKSPTEDSKIREMQETLSAKRAEREKFQKQSSPPKPSIKGKDNKHNRSSDGIRWKDLEKAKQKARKLLAASMTEHS